MSATVIYCDSDQLDSAGRQYVELGVPALRAERQRDVDGAKAFLLSDAAAKLRPCGLQPKETPLTKPARTVLDAMDYAALRISIPPK